MAERHAIFAAIGVLCLGLFATTVRPPRPLLIWNASPSAPVGLYRVSAAGSAVKGDMVIARPPERYRRFAARRHYLPLNVPLVKRIAATPGDIICARGLKIFINGRWVADRRQRDGKGRLMPRWSGCVTLRLGFHLLLMDSPTSFDGRYFGLTDPRDIIGKARLIWAMP